MSLPIQLSAPGNYKEQSYKFAEQYNFVLADLGLQSNASSLNTKQNRKCRFCGKAYPVVTFRNSAHLISNLVGNETLFSDFECDNCNKKFGHLYENDLANFLGISRSLVGSKVKGGIPIFKCADKILTVRSGVIQGIDVTVLYRADSAKGFFKTNKKTGRTTFIYRKHSYRPNMVYKAFLKWALSVLPQAEIPNYQGAFDLLNQKIELRTGCFISGYHLPFNINFPPHYFLYRKKDPAFKTHTHVVAFYFQNYILSFPIPFYKEDSFMMNKENEIVLYPPLFTQFTDYRNFVIRPFHYELNRQEKITDEKEEVVVIINPDQLSNSAVYDEKTDQVYSKPYDPADLKSCILLRGGHEHEVIPKEFMAKVKEYFT